MPPTNTTRADQHRPEATSSSLRSVPAPAASAATAGLGEAGSLLPSLVPSLNSKLRQAGSTLAGAHHVRLWQAQVWQRRCGSAGGWQEACRGHWQAVGPALAPPRRVW